MQRYYPRVRELVRRELQHDFRKRHRWILPLFSTRDVVHGVFVEVIRSGMEGCSFENESAFVRYLGTIVRHRLLDAVRFHEAGKRDARRRVDSPEEGIECLARGTEDTPALAAELAEQAALVREVLQSFPERHRALLEMRLVDEETYTTIAERLGYASAETARQAFLEAKAKLLVRLRARGVRPGGTGS